MNVPNRGCIRNLSIKNMKASKSRNIIAASAIALTAVLFTSLFTILISAAYGFEQSNFRQIGGYQHGGLKNLTAEQLEEFRYDRRIAEYGTRMFIGSPKNAPFAKSHTEISSVDENYAKFTFVNFAEGGLPAENTNEAAADSRVLSLLGVTPETGAEFTLTFDVAGRETTETFTLCGWWEYDGAMPANNVFLPQSRGNEIFEKLGVTRGEDGITGLYSLDFMLKSGSLHIEKDIIGMLEDRGYQSAFPNEENYIGCGVNWGYISAQAGNFMDIGTALAITALLALIVLTGYLIICNVFRISVSNDIRYYGLLKTIGTTGAQIKRIISIQALSLSAAGIPAGLIIGYGVGAILSPVVMNQLNGVKSDALSVNPLIFVFAAVFSLATVMISCHKPGKEAAKISPVEAVRYTESDGGKSVRRSEKGASPKGMALANLNRSRGKTLTAVLSLSLSALLLNLTVTFANGFDMDKYLRQMPADFIIADAGYFSWDGIWDEDKALPEDVISAIKENADISGIGAAYGEITGSSSFAPKEHIIEKARQYLSELYDNFDAESYAEGLYTDSGGLYEHSSRLYGMDKFCLDKLNVIEGDISKLYEGDKYIAAVYDEDDYGSPIKSSHWAKPGDIITIVWIDGYDTVWTDTVTGETYAEYKDIPESMRKQVKLKWSDTHTKKYEVAASVTVPHAISYRYYNSADSYILNSGTFIKDSGTDKILYAAFDVKDGAEDAAEKFISDYTANVRPDLDYESKNTYADDFASFREMFLILGGALSFIVGLVGILNFVSVTLTGIFSRRRELAVLQSVGMTGKQLKEMLVTEGLLYTVGSAAASLLLAVIFSPLSKKALEGMFWFFSFKFTVLPILALIPVFGALGAAIPLISYKNTVRKSVVERLRETE